MGDNISLADRVDLVDETDRLESGGRYRGPMANCRLFEKTEPRHEAEEDIL